MHRRRFIRTAACAPLVVASWNSLLAAGVNKAYLDNIGIQLYTVRHQLGKDRKGTLQAIKEMGYAQVEPYEFPKNKALVEDAKAVGLAVNSTHIEWNSVLDPNMKGVPAFEKVLEEARSLGIKHLVIPTIEGKDRTVDGYKRAAEKCNRAAESAKSAGIQLAYHNHTFEFDPMENGKAGFDILIEEFDSEMVFEVDVFWVQLGNRDPRKLIETLKGRVSQIHLKDLKAGVKLPEKIDGWWSLTPETFAELGEGIIQLNPILETAKATGVKYCHVEQDLSLDPLQSIQKSLAYLRS